MTIVDSIAEVQTEFVQVRKTKVDEEVIVNAFLDFLITTQREFDSLTDKLSYINDEIYSNINVLNEDPNKLLEATKRLLVEGRKVVAVYKKRPKIYAGIKTSLSAFERELNALKEISQDIDLIYNRVPNNTKLNSLFDQI